MKRNAALLVIDVQRAYMEPTPMVTSDGDDLLEKCRLLISAARAARVPVIFVRHLDDQSPADEALTAVHPALAPARGEPVVVKTFGSAFMKTDLEKLLAAGKIKDLVMCGLATFGCVNHTVLCALCKGYDVTVAADAHGTVQGGTYSPDETIREFNSTWERAGARLARASEVAF